MKRFFVLLSFLALILVPIFSDTFPPFPVNMEISMYNQGGVVLIFSSTTATWDKPVPTSLEQVDQFIPSQESPYDIFMAWRLDSANGYRLAVETTQMYYNGEPITMNPGNTFHITLTGDITLEDCPLPPIGTPYTITEFPLNSGEKSSQLTITSRNGFGLMYGLYTSTFIFSAIDYVR